MADSDSGPWLSPQAPVRVICTDYRNWCDGIFFYRNKAIGLKATSTRDRRAYRDRFCTESKVTVGGRRDRDLQHGDSSRAE